MTLFVKLASREASQKQKVVEAYGGNSNNNKWIHQDLSEILMITEHVSERNWICGLISVIVLQVCEREDYIFI